MLIIQNSEPYKKCIIEILTGFSFEKKTLSHRLVHPKKCGTTTALYSTDFTQTSIYFFKI